MFEWWQRGTSIVQHTIERAEKENRELQVQWKEICRVPSIVDSLKNSNGSSSVLTEGDIILKKINFYLDYMYELRGWQRNEYQIQFHEAFTEAALPRIYGKDWEANSARVMLKYNTLKINPYVLALTPRRLGKTISVASWVLAYMVCRYGDIVITFSTGKRASTLMMGEVKKFISFIPGMTDKIVEANQEVLRLAQAIKSNDLQTKANLRTASTTSTFYSVPSNPNGTYLFLNTLFHFFVFRCFSFFRDSMCTGQQLSNNHLLYILSRNVVVCCLLFTG